jgi:homocysteine S-methyltransferase
MLDKNAMNDSTPTNPVSTGLERQGFLLLDGGLATEMERHGANLEDELWSARMLLESPELVQRVHSAFLEAGADIIATATYQASFEGFRAKGIDHRKGEQLLLLGAELAVLAREQFWSDYANHRRRLRPLVAASIGPYGAILHDGSEYHGNYDLNRRALRDFHRSRLDILAESDADLLAFETIPSQEEAEILLELLEDYPARQAWLSYSCRNGAEVSHGEPFSVCAALTDQSPQTVAVGVNCTAPGNIAALLESASGLETPLAAYPNSGEHWNAASQDWEGEVCGEFAVEEWHAKGARLIGGCCRTTTEHIARMRERLLAGIAVE